MQIRPAIESDWPIIRDLFRAVADAGDAFAYDASTSDETIRKLWFDAPACPYVLEIEGQIAGTYYIRPNQPGRGSHIANGGYIVAESYRGRGLSKVMCEDSIAEAKRLGYRAMQFNFVVATNETAIRCWQSCGFEIVGRIPNAFDHARQGPVDALVMYRDLKLD
jgi:L-amino acid N-acyltransferase YncA